MPTRSARRPTARIRPQHILPFEVTMRDPGDRDMATVGSLMLNSRGLQDYIGEGWLDRLQRTPGRKQRLIGLLALAARCFTAGVHNERLRNNGRH